mgnify:CR=1 FL=1
MNWKDNLDNSTRKHLEAQLKETLRNKKAILNSNDKKNAQLWVAVAGLSQQVLDLSLRIKFLEKVLQETIGKKRENKEDVKKIMDSLYKF